MIHAVFRDINEFLPKSMAELFSLVQTAKVNGLVAEAYLEWAMPILANSIWSISFRGRARS
jgi:hypothetical protein